MRSNAQALSDTHHKCSTVNRIISDAVPSDRLQQDLNWRAVFGAAPVGMLLIDECAVVTEVNDVVGKLVGKAPGEIVNTRPGEGLGCIHSHDGPDGCGSGPACGSCDLRNAFERVMVSGQAVRDIETQAVLDIGGSKVAVWLAANFEVAMIDGRKHVLLAIDNITSRKEVEHRQAALLEEVKTVNQELKEFAYIVSHDLKAPLRGIRTLAQWLAEDFSDKLGSEGKEQIDLLLGRTDRMQSLIDGVLRYSRATRTREHLLVVNLDELLGETIDALAAPKHISISVDDPLPSVLAEPTQMVQLFQNLLSNAIKYIDKTHGIIRIGCTDLGDYWQFMVADNGPGIAEEHRERVFRIFQTLSSIDECQSTGVGLAVVKKIVELYGGDIWIDSQLGEGATFVFTLPKNNTEGVDDVRRRASAAC